MTEHGPDGAHARFSTCKRFRYTLHREIPREESSVAGVGPGGRRAVFVMLNPSTADAFVLDPTIRRCVVFARRWGCDSLDVVNLFALRSPHPADLYATRKASRNALHRDDVAAARIGADLANDYAIQATCQNAEIVIAAWGNHGDDFKLSDRRGRRGSSVRTALELAGVKLHHLGLSNLGAPLHPLARGKSMIPYDRKPERWTP